MCRLLLMLAPRSFTTMRLLGVATVIALITLVTAFNYEASGLPFVSEPDGPTEPNDLQAEPVGEFIAPVEVLHRTGDTRLFVVSLLGTVTASDGITQTTVLDVTDRTVMDGERGLLGAAFHPRGDLLYVHYSDAAGDSIIAEYTVDPDTAIADPASSRTVMIVEQPYANHNGGELTFGPDGYLYAGFGDGGLADDPDRSALDLSSPLGKILRFDPSPSNGEAFTVPADNPFVDTEGADPTIWSYGLRNPWKFSFDRATDGLWIADVGQNLWEEINYAAATDKGAGRGLSFGWSAYEGNERFNDDQDAGGHVAPFVAYERADGRCSISGGAVYRGSSQPDLSGWYVYGDYCTGEILAFNTSASDADRKIAGLGQVESLVAIAAGPDGELYAASVLGTVYRLT